MRRTSSMYQVIRMCANTVITYCMALILDYAYRYAERARSLEQTFLNAIQIQRYGNAMEIDNEYIHSFASNYLCTINR